MWQSSRPAGALLGWAGAWTRALRPLCSVLPGGWVLRVNRARAQDGGRYSCLASNIAGEARRHFHVEVLGKEEGSFVCCRIRGRTSELYHCRDSHELRLGMVGASVPESFVP